MSRELKFRVWDKAKNKFINPFKFEWDNYYKTTGMVLLDLNGKIRIADYSIGNGDNSASSVYSEVDNPDNYIIQQYTGLKDKYDNPIYEGDIIKEHHFEDWGDTVGYEYRGVVRYKMYDTSDVNRKFSGFITFPNELENKNYSGNPIHSDCEVIGNIFEHKHLLEK